MKGPLHSTSDASRVAALLLPRILPVFSVVVPGQPGTSLVSVRRGTFTTGCRGRCYHRPMTTPSSVSFSDLVAAGSMQAAKAAGKVRIEGKDYVMSDGDVVEFRFNV